MPSKKPKASPSPNGAEKGARNRNINYEDFVRAWKDASSVGEVAGKMNLTTKACSARASFLRRKGVNLKQIRRNNGIDVGGLNKILED